MLVFQFCARAKQGPSEGRKRGIKLQDCAGAPAIPENACKLPADFRVLENTLLSGIQSRPYLYKVSCKQRQALSPVEP